MSISYFSILLNDLSKSIKLPGLIPDEDNCCSLVVDENITIDLQYCEESEQLELIALVCEMPVIAQEQVAMKLLQANFQWIGSGGGTLSVAPDESAIFLGIKEDIKAINYAHFENIFVTFIDNCEFWQEKVHEFTFTLPEASIESDISLDLSQLIRI